MPGKKKDLTETVADFLLHGTGGAEKRMKTGFVGSRRFSKQSCLKGWHVKEIIVGDVKGLVYLSEKSGRRAAQIALQAADIAGGNSQELAQFCLRKPQCVPFRANESPQMGYLRGLFEIVVHKYITP